MTEEMREWAEDHGYSRGRCPVCGSVVWSDTGVFECPCGYDIDEENEDGVE